MCAMLDAVARPMMALFAIFALMCLVDAQSGGPTTGELLPALMKRAASADIPAPADVESIFPLTRPQKEMAYFWERISLFQVLCLCKIARKRIPARSEHNDETTGARNKAILGRIVLTDELYTQCLKEGAEKAQRERNGHPSWITVNDVVPAMDEPFIVFHREHRFNVELCLCEDSVVPAALRQAFWESTGGKYAGARMRLYCEEESLSAPYFPKYLIGFVPEPGAEPPSKRLLDMLPKYSAPVAQQFTAAGVARADVRRDSRRAPLMDRLSGAAQRAAGMWAGVHGAQLADTKKGLQQLPQNVVAHIARGRREQAAGLGWNKPGTGAGARLLNARPGLGM